MGADFIFAAACWPGDEAGVAIAAGPGLVSEVLKRLAVAEFSEEVLDDYGFFLEEDEEDAEALNEARSEARDACAEFVRDTFGSPSSWSRDLGYLERGPHCNLLLTGGMSWGDDPSDSFRMVNLLSNLGITNGVFDRDAIAAFDAQLDGGTTTPDGQEN